MVAWLPGMRFSPTCLPTQGPGTKQPLQKEMTKKLDSFRESVAFGSGTAVACLMTGTLAGAVTSDKSREGGV
jgi:hypothetical protein